MRTPILLLSLLSLGAQAQTSETIQARVLSIQPQYSRVETPRQVCEVEPQREVREGERGYGGSVLGGLAGAAIGSRFGNGQGRAATTIAGAIGGAIIGDRVQNSEVREEPRRRCHTEYDSREVLNNYRVTYALNGQTFTTTTRRDPGNLIALRITPQE